MLSLIEKDLIQQAKEKLGIENAFWMSELLGIDDFNEKSLKCKCVFHNENTPSFVYNPKKYNFHCFGGCGTTVDIIDVLCLNGDTFLDATKKLCEKASIDFVAPEQHLKTKQKYRYPKEVENCNDKQNVYRYLESRCISKKTIDLLDVREDYNGNIVFNTYDTNDALTVVNYRLSRKINKDEKVNKCWFQKDADTADLLWNMNRVNTSKPLVITEGQIDCMSIIESGYPNCVSVLKGSQGLGWIEECFDWLEQFDSIIIFSDNDPPGIKMRTEIINRLGAWRCKYVEAPSKLLHLTSGKVVTVKDANEILQCQGKKYLLDLLDNAKDMPITSVSRLVDIEELNPYDMDGFETGIKGLDDEIMKIFTGGVTLITGAPSAGKTTLLNQLSLMSMDSGFPVFLFSRELLNGMSKSWLNNVAAGKQNMKEITLKNDKKFMVVKDEAKIEIANFYSDLFYIYRDEEGNDVDSLMSSLEICVRKKGIKTIIIDNLMTVNLNCDDQGQNKAQTDFMMRLIKFSMRYNVSVICVAHPRKLQSGADISLFDVAGSSNIVNLATRTISLKRVKEDDKMNQSYKYYGYDVIVSVVKDRIFGSTKDIPVYYDKDSRRFYSDSKELYRSYKWDNNVHEVSCNDVDYLYKSPLDYPFE